MNLKLICSSTCATYTPISRTWNSRKLSSLLGCWCSATSCTPQCQMPCLHYKCATLVDDFPLVQEQEAIELGEHLVAGLVDGEDHCAALLLGQSVEDLEHVVGHVAVQPRSGLVQDQQVRFRNHLDCDAHSLLLAARDALHELAADIGVLALLQSEVPDQLLHSLLRLDLVFDLESGCELQSLCVLAMSYLSQSAPRWGCRSDTRRRRSCRRQSGRTPRC